METANKRRPVKQPVAAVPLDRKVEAVAKVSMGKNLSPNQCRKYLRRTVAEAYRDIVAGFVDEARGGSCQHLKMATEVVESTRRAKQVRRVKGAAAMMLEKLEREFPAGSS